MNRTNNVASCMYAAMLVVGATTPTLAQSTSPSAGASSADVGVMERARPAYDPKGIPLGGFRLFPELTTTATYDDNVLRTNAPQSDWEFLISPNARLKSTWGRHFVELYAGLNRYDYASLSGEDLTDWRIGTDGRVDISRAANITTNVYYGEDHELWSAPNNLNGFQAAPNRFFQVHVDTVGTYQPNRLGVAVGGSFDSYNWTRTPQNGGGFIDNNDRDENELQSYVRVFYDFLPAYRAYVQASYDERDFDQYLDRSGDHRSSHGFRVDGGMDILITHTVKGEVFFGYLQHNFSSSILSDVAGIDYGAQLDWFADETLTIHLSGRRSLDDTILSGVSMADNKSISLGADYEFRPDIIVRLSGSYTNSQFRGDSRSDDSPAVGVGIIYLVNRYASLNLNYRYSERSTQNAAFDYQDNMLSLGFTAHL